MHLPIVAENLHHACVDADISYRNLIPTVARRLGFYINRFANNAPALSQK